MTSAPFFFSTGGTQSAAPLVIDDMVAWWKLNEGSGTTINDSTASNFDGAFTIASWSGAGTGKGYNQAAYIPGSTGTWIQFGDILYSDTLTLACWITLSDVTTKFHSLIVKTNAIGTSTAGDNEFRMYVEAGVLKITAQDSSGASVLSINSSTTIPAINTWCHVAAVLRGSGNVGTVYINGVNVGTATQTGTIRDSASDLQLGCRVAGNNARFMNGFMQDARIYTRGLSDAEIALLHSTTDV